MVDKVDKSEWYTHLATVGHLTKTISDPRISSWNVGPHGFRGGREEIFALFETGDPIICLQDLRIPENIVDAVKSELHALFPHYWIYITSRSTRGAPKAQKGEELVSRQVQADRSPSPLKLKTVVNFTSSIFTNSPPTTEASKT